jgi:hypothetical protein
MTCNKIFKKIELENKYTLPKIKTNKIFINKVEYPNREIRREADFYFENDNFKKLPYIFVDIKNIFPTQDNITINNLKSVKNISQETDAYLCNIENKFYVLDGHHRIAMNILNGFYKIKAFVYNNENEYSIGGL